MPYKKVYFPKKVPGGATHWDEKKKIEVLQAYILLGQLRMAAATCGVPEPTVKVWRQSQWWKDMEYELRRSSKIQLSTKLNEIVGKAAEQLKDRVENGDFIYNPRTKEFTRKPISAEHANRIVANQIDRMQAIDKSAHAEKIDPDDIKARLDKLKQDLIKGFSKPILVQKALLGEVIEVPIDGDSSSLRPSSDLVGDSQGPGLSASALAEIEAEGPPRAE